MSTRLRKPSNSFSKSCEFQNYDRDSVHLEMVLIAAPQKIKEKLLLTPDLTLDIAKNILKTMEVGSKWVSQASSIKLEYNKDVKIKQEVNLNLAKRDKQKGLNTSEAGGSRKRFACSRCGSNKHASNDKACPALGKKCNKCTLTMHFFFFLDLLKEVESSLRTNRDCLASLKCRTPCQLLLTKPPPKEDKTKNNMSKGKEPISPKTPMQS